MVQGPAQEIPQKATPQRSGSLASLPGVKLDPALIQKLQVFPSREMLINSLMGNQATRNTLETLTRNAKMQVHELSKKSLDGVIVTAYPTAAGVKRIEELNWTGGIKFSLIKNIPPKFFDPVSKKLLPVGSLYVKDIVLSTDSAGNNALQCVNADAFDVSRSYMNGDEAIFLAVLTPPKPFAYMIAVQGIRGNVYVQDCKGKYLATVDSSTIGGIVGITDVCPVGDPPYSGFTIRITKPIGFSVDPKFTYSFAPFGGITITRL